MAKYVKCVIKLSKYIIIYLIRSERVFFFGFGLGKLVHIFVACALRRYMYIVHSTRVLVFFFQGIGYNFDFKISFKYLRKTDAHLRYGNSTVATWRGNLVASTYCDRILEQCDVRTCRIQSPNYPGIYPRNITCYYRVEVRENVRGQHSLIAVSQRYAHKIHMKDQVIKYDRSQRTLR